MPRDLIAQSSWLAFFAIAAGGALAQILRLAGVEL